MIIDLLQNIAIYESNTKCPFASTCIFIVTYTEMLIFLVETKTILWQQTFPNANKDVTFKNTAKLQCDKL